MNRSVKSVFTKSFLQLKFLFYPLVRVGDLHLIARNTLSFYIPDSYITSRLPLTLQLKLFHPAIVLVILRVFFFVYLLFFPGIS